jgi:hypothetical protein
MLVKLTPERGRLFPSVIVRGCRSAWRGFRSSYSSQPNLPHGSFANPSEVNVTIVLRYETKKIDRFKTELKKF